MLHTNSMIHTTLYNANLGRLFKNYLLTRNYYSYADQLNGPHICLGGLAV